MDFEQLISGNDNSNNNNNNNQLQVSGIIASPQAPNEKALNLFSPEELFVWEEEKRSGDISDFGMFDTGQLNIIEDARYGSYKLLSINPNAILRDSSYKYLATLSILYKQQIMSIIQLAAPSLRARLASLPLNAIFTHYKRVRPFKLIFDSIYGSEPLKHGYDMGFDVINITNGEDDNLIERIRGSETYQLRFLYAVINYGLTLIQSSYMNVIEKRFNTTPDYLHFAFDNFTIQYDWLDKIFSQSPIGMRDLLNPDLISEWECNLEGLEVTLRETETYTESYFEQIVRQPSPFDIVWTGSETTERIPRQREASRNKTFIITWNFMTTVQHLYPSI